MKYCPYCGADIPDGAVSFCAECGKALPAKKEKPEKSTPVKKSSAGKKKKHKKAPTVDCVDSSPQWEPYKKPFLEERCHEVTERWQKNKDGQ